MSVAPWNFMAFLCFESPVLSGAWRNEVFLPEFLLAVSLVLGALCFGLLWGLQGP